VVVNIRDAFLHLVGDASVSAGVVLAGAVIYFSGWNWLDPLASLMISVMIAWITWRLIKSVVMDAQLIL
jgi:cobalt-zinc-cadmium efflux system protein